MDCVENRLLDPERLAQVEERYRAAASTVVIDYGPKIVELERQRANLVDAITTGGLAEELGPKLKTVRAELERLKALQSKPITARPALSAEAIERRVEEIKRRLAEGGDIARATLRELFPNAISLEPDDSGSHLWAVFLDDEVSRISLLYDTRDELLDAQAAATLAAFARAEAERRVGNNGSGGSICHLLARLPRRKRR
jgi:hypothetical protein